MELRSESSCRLSKILPINEPMITTYTQHAHLLSILGIYDFTYSWIFSNYIQLYINKDYKHNWSDFYFPFPYELRSVDTCKWIKSQKLDRKITVKWSSIIDFVIDCVNSNNYVHTMINYFYLPVSDRYNRKNLNHDILIYGYDLEEDILYVSDFFKNGVYNNEKISFSDFSLAYAKYDQAINNDYLNEMIYLYKLNKQYDYKFNIKNITNSIKDYLTCNIPEYWNNYNADNKEAIVFGMDIYSTLRNYINIVISKEESYFDIRPFYLLYDHKKMMYLRLKFMNKQGYFLKIDYNQNIVCINEIMVMAKTLVNLITKYNYSRKITLKDRMIELLSDIEKKEYYVLKQYILD